MQKLQPPPKQGCTSCAGDQAQRYACCRSVMMRATREPGRVPGRHAGRHARAWPEGCHCWHPSVPGASASPSSPSSSLPFCRKCKFDDDCRCADCEGESSFGVAAAPPAPLANRRLAAESLTWPAPPSVCCIVHMAWRICICMDQAPGVSWPAVDPAKVGEKCKDKDGPCGMDDICAPNGACPERYMPSTTVCRWALPRAGLLVACWPLLTLLHSVSSS